MMEYFFTRKGKMSFVLCTCLLFLSVSTMTKAASFSLNKTPTVTEENDAGLSIPLTKDIVSTGYGLNKEQALKIAFRITIEQYIGVIIDSRSMLENAALIDDSLLTTPKDFIQTYEEIASTEEDGLWAVKILAKVQSQKLGKMIHQLNISMAAIKGEKTTLVPIKTKQVTKKDAVALIDKAWNDAWNDAALLNLISVNIDNVKVLKNQEEDEHVPLSISYSIHVNYEKYQATIEKLEELFKQLGAKEEKRFDIPTISKNGVIGVSNLVAMQSFQNKFSQASSIAFMKHYGKGLVVNVWTFPSAWQIHKSLNTHLFKNFHFILEVKDTNHAMLYPKSFTMTDNIFIFSAYIFYDHYYNSLSSHSTIIVPFLAGMNKQLNASDNIIQTNISIPIDIADVQNIGEITLEFEHK